MRLEHRFTVPASVEQAWAVLNDLEQVVPCFPGASLTSVDGDEFAGACKIKLGPISLQYNGTGRFAERDEAAHRVVVEGKGKDRRGNGTATVLVTAQLTGSGDAATAVAVDTDLTITGKPAQFGRGLIQEVSDKLLEQFVSCMTSKLSDSGSKPRPTDVLFGGGRDGGSDAGQAEGQVTGKAAGSGQAAGSGRAAGQEAGLGQAVGAGRGSGLGQAARPGAGGGSTSGPSAVSHARTGAGPHGRSDSGSATPSGSGAEAEARSGTQSSAPDEAEAVVDLGAALLPVLAKRLAPYVIGAAAALLLRRLFSR